ncbi:hypothetical protein BDV25DRAFT_142993 [Aspergillus avenaceus]|uniref:Uncharacterized protein n=1 Tax=Aspergillus avenaceus TaxID=36643 RepID=A0A5N6TLE3_ASPAV|nr:hypothetical protein BDV25DRAFT_142993 [Aspergillus avenaceus]
MKLALVLLACANLGAVAAAAAAASPAPSPAPEESDSGLVTFGEEMTMLEDEISVLSGKDCLTTSDSVAASPEHSAGRCVADWGTDAGIASGIGVAVTTNAKVRARIEC